MKRSTLKTNPGKGFLPGRNTIAIFILLLFGALVKHNSSVPYIIDVSPGANKAILALSNGRRINLSNTKKGLLLKYQGTEIIKAEDSTLIFKLDESKLRDFNYSTITVPKGEQYKIVLADETCVWLNAASSLSFRTSLKGDLGERRIKLSGEAYFDVKKDEAKPFIVMAGNQEVQVLGTQFNISAYPNEQSIRTTLIEGSVRISATLAVSCFGEQGKTEIVLKPNQQSMITKNNFQIEDVDIEDAIAWKNGYLVFQNEPLGNIMQEISRWYNVDVVYEDQKLTEKILAGVMSRSDELPKVLSMLETVANIQIKVHGRKVTITR